ncbi:cytochrome P450 [Streptomyces sp. TP-A0874]|uniref:cytochrome P450 n=1 Tax=Streptomyces sp. TP-A0874 TaxID=549819 RepID=UPI000853ED6D|nr:cytochrome P450 [Streptomyces sp. TP-A0874]
MTSDLSGDVSWASPEFGRDPYPLLRHHRDRGLVYDHTSEGWLALRHAEVSELLRSSRYAKNPQRALDGPYTRLQRDMAGSSIMFMDDPDARRVRGLTSRAFARRQVTALRPRIEALASGLMDDLTGEDTFDLMARYAAPLSVGVIAMVLGLPEADRELLARWSEDLKREYDPALSPEDQTRIAQSRRESVVYFIEEIEARAREPRADLITALVQAHDERGRLSLEELISTLVTLLVAGNVSTTDLIGNAVLALLEHPEQLELLRADPSLMPNAVEEVLRYDSPVTLTDRIATEDTEIAGCPVVRGEWIWAALVSANHDPSVHPEPERFDVTRSDIQHLSFGAGSRLCLGAELSRVETQVALATLLDRCPSLALAPGPAPERHTVPAFRGLVELRVTRG